MSGVGVAVHINAHGHLDIVQRGVCGHLILVEGGDGARADIVGSASHVIPSRAAYFAGLAGHQCQELQSPRPHTIAVLQISKPRRCIIQRLSGLVNHLRQFAWLWQYLGEVAFPAGWIVALTMSGHCGP